MTITVIGTPGPQGSKSFKGMRGGHAILTESSAKVKPWREAVIYKARENGKKFIGAVSVECVFTLVKPKTAPKRRRTLPDKKPDIDKLLRSTLDALKMAGTIEDDARVVEVSGHKRYPNEGDGALDVPGALITIRTMEATA